MLPRYYISRLSEEKALEITTWHYQPPYDLYDLSENNLAGFLNLDNRYHQVLDQAGSLIGYCCYGLDARVPGGDYQQGEPEVIDVGVGMHPDLVGQGKGVGFVRSVLEYGKEEYKPQKFRVTIADFNIRSKTTFMNLGFIIIGNFIRELVNLKFVQLERQAKEASNGESR
jgi:RimJ/RimL family protein N-acetyltransferase